MSTISFVNIFTIFQFSNTQTNKGNEKPLRKLKGFFLPKVGIEPTYPKVHDFESCASACSATPARCSSILANPFAGQEISGSTIKNPPISERVYWINLAYFGVNTWKLSNSTVTGTPSYVPENTPTSPVVRSLSFTLAIS